MNCGGSKTELPGSYWLWECKRSTPDVKFLTLLMDSFSTRQSGGSRRLLPSNSQLGPWIIFLCHSPNQNISWKGGTPWRLCWMAVCWMCSTQTFSVFPTSFSSAVLFIFVAKHLIAGWVKFHYGKSCTSTLPSSYPKSFCLFLSIPKPPPSAKGKPEVAR